MAPVEPAPVEDIEPVELSVLVEPPPAAPLLIPALPPTVEPPVLPRTRLVALSQHLLCVPAALVRERSLIEPMTLGQALAAKVRLIVWCKACQHQAEPDIAEQVARHGEAMTVIDWALRPPEQLAFDLDSINTAPARNWQRRSAAGKDRDQGEHRQRRGDHAAYLRVVRGAALARLLGPHARFPL